MPRSIGFWRITLNPLETRSPDRYSLIGFMFTGTPSLLSCSLVLPGRFRVYWYSLVCFHVYWYSLAGFMFTGTPQFAFTFTCTPQFGLLLYWYSLVGSMFTGTP